VGLFELLYASAAGLVVRRKFSCAAAIAVAAVEEQQVGKFISAAAATKAVRKRSCRRDNS
jgi:hypothetical protein